MSESALLSIYIFRPIDETLCTSGQPSVTQLGRIAKEGFTTVINLSLHDDPQYSLPDESGTVQSLGMTYIHIPVQFAAPTHADLLAFFPPWTRIVAKRCWCIAQPICAFPHFLACIESLSKVASVSGRLS
jgi:hypothetical protein